MERGLIFYIFTLLLCSLFQFTHQKNDQEQQSQSQHHQQNHHHKLEEAPVRVDPRRNVKVIIPNLPPNQYRFWLKNHPRAFANFEELCKEADVADGRLGNMSDLATFQRLHNKLHFEDPRYMFDLDYGKATLELICARIGSVPKSCWGYENKCQEIYLMPECLGTSHGEAGSEQEQKIEWFTQADFGYILERRKELSKFCAPDKRANLPDASSLECSKHFSTCRGENLFLQFDSGSRFLGAREKLTINKVGGRSCDLQLERIKEETGRRAAFESWYGELEKYHLVDSSEQCNLTIDKQVFFLKINRTLNLNDYLGTFINLYATMHLNNRFSDDVQIVIWDKRMPRDNRFDHMLYAFSRHRPISAGEWAGKNVCVRRFVFAMPHKMVDGLNNRKSLIGGCRKSGLYSAFHNHVVHRLGLPVTYDRAFHERTRNSLVRVAILSRSDADLRAIVNEQELSESIQRLSKMIFVQVIKYNEMDFTQVLANVLNSDILIGIHGSGLSYSLFAPDWASIIELHDCGKSTYEDMARLRGLNYHRQENLARRVPVAGESELNANRSETLDDDLSSNYEVDLKGFHELFERVKEKLLKSRASHFKSLTVKQREVDEDKSTQPEVDAPTPSSPVTAETSATTKASDLIKQEQTGETAQPTSSQAPSREAEAEAEAEDTTDTEVDVEEDGAENTVHSGHHTEL